MKLTVDEIARATGARRVFALPYTDYLNVAMDRFNIDSIRNVSAFLATVGVESANLSKAEEGLFYREAARLVRIFPRAFTDERSAAPYTKNPVGLSKLLYGGYHGRGLIQLTWERNYRAAGDALGFDYVGNPGLLLQPKHAALSAAWFWKENGCSAAAERGDMRDVTLRVNGPALLHLVERSALYEANVKWVA